MLAAHPRLLLTEFDLFPVLERGPFAHRLALTMLGPGLGQAYSPSLCILEWGRDRGGRAAVAKPPARTTPGVTYPNAGRQALVGNTPSGTDGGVRS